MTVKMRLLNGKTVGWKDGVIESRYPYIEEKEYEDRVEFRIVIADQRPIAAGGKSDEYFERYTTQWFRGRNFSGQEDRVWIVYRAIPRFPWNSFTKDRRKVLAFVTEDSQKYKADFNATWPKITTHGVGV